MSNIYSLGCKECKVTLDIGQDDYIWFKYEDAMGKLQKFLFDHEEHDLVFGDENYFTNGIKYKEIDS